MPARNTGSTSSRYTALVAVGVGPVLAGADQAEALRVPDAHGVAARRGAPRPSIGSVCESGIRSRMPPQ